MSNYIQVVVPHKKCVAMKAVLTATFLKKPIVSYSCKYCYRKMRKPATNTLKHTTTSGENKKK